MQKMFPIFIVLFFAFFVDAQEIVALDSLSVVSFEKKHYKRLKNKEKGGKLYCSFNHTVELISEFEFKEKHIGKQLKGIEFSFNDELNYYGKTFDFEGIYVRPVMYSWENGFPKKSLMKESEIRYIPPEFNQKIILSLEKENLIIQEKKYFFGVEIIELDNDTRKNYYQILTFLSEKRSFIKSIQYSDFELITHPLALTKKGRIYQSIYFQLYLSE